MEGMAPAVAMGCDGWFQAGWTAAVFAPFQATPPPTLLGGRKRLSATMFCGAPRLAGMGWFILVGELCGSEPVVVGSPKVRLPRLEHPVRATAATIRPAIATAPLGARRDTRILISLLVRRYSTRV